MNLYQAWYHFLDWKISVSGSRIPYQAQDIVEITSNGHDAFLFEMIVQCIHCVVYCMKGMFCSAFMDDHTLSFVRRKKFYKHKILVHQSWQAWFSAMLILTMRMMMMKMHEALICRQVRATKWQHCRILWEQHVVQLHHENLFERMHQMSHNAFVKLQ